MTSIFLSYARDDDEAFVHRLHADLTNAGFNVWFDRVSMPARQLPFPQEIRDAIAACDRLLLVVGPGILTSDWAIKEWRFAYFEADKCVNPIVRLNGRKTGGSTTGGATSGSQIIDGYNLIPEDLKTLHAEDFRDDAYYDAHLANLIRQLSEPPAPLGKLVAVPELPACFIAQPDRIKALRDLLLVDLQRPVVVSGAAARIGLQGMGGIGKSVLASALARRPEVRRAFPDGIFWITLGQKPQLAEQQRWLARQLGDEALFPDERSGKETLRKLLSGRKVLLVLDDVWQREHAEAFNVIGAMGRILLTTRDAGLVTALASTECHYKVELPTEAEAEAIFASAAQPRPGEPPVAITPAEHREIVAQCGRLPLALALCGGMVQAGVSPADVLQALREHDLEFLSSNYPAEEQHQNVWKAMDVSLRVLPPEERSRFAELAVFPLDRGAPEAAVVTLWEHTGGLTPRQARKLLTDFKERSLVQLTPATNVDGQPTVQMTLHDLLHNFATGMAEKQFGSRAALHLCLLDAYGKKCPNGWPSGPDDGYYFQNLCEHMLTAGKLDDAVVLLTGLPWIEAKCKAKLFDSLLKDYRSVIAVLSEAHEGQQVERDQATRETLNLIQGTLRLRLYLVDKDQSQLASQLRGRLLAYQNIPGIAAFIENIDVYTPYPRLRPLWPALQATGGPMLRVLEGHTGGVYAVVLSANGKLAVSASGDGTVRVWDLEGNLPPRVLKGHKYTVYAVALSADGKRAVSGSLDNTVRVWDLEGNQPSRILVGHKSSVRAVAISADGTRAISGSDDKTVMVWDLEGNQRPRVLEGHDGEVYSVALSADGKRAISGSGGTLDPDFDVEINTVRVWDLEGNQSPRVLEGHTNQVTAVALSADGKRAVSGSWDMTLRVWDLEGSQPPRILKGHTWFVNAIAISGDGHRAVSGSHDKTLRVWDLDGNEPTRVLQGHMSWVFAVALSADGKRVVSGSDNTLHVWDLEANQSSHVVESHLSYVTAVALSADGKRAIFGSRDHSLRVWDLDNNQPSCILEGHTGGIHAVALSANGQFAVSGSQDKTVRIWNLEGDQSPRILEGHSGPVAISANGKRVVFGSIEHTLQVWDIEGNQPLRVLEGHTDAIRAVVLSADGGHAVSCSWDRTVRVWDLDGNQPPYILERHTEAIRAVALSADGKRVAFSRYDNNYGGNGEHTLRVWDLKGDEPLRVLKGHASWIWAVALSSDGKRAVSGSWDNTLRVWDLESGNCLAVFTCDDWVDCCAWANERIVAVDHSGHVHLFAWEE